MQSKKKSFIESLVNTGSGLLISYIAQVIIFKYFLGVEVEFAENLFILGVFTAISLTRNYIIRRIFSKNE